MLKTQPTVRPTRKMWGVLIASAVTSIANIAIQRYIPLMATPEVLALIQAGAVVVVGYVVKDRA